MSNWQKFWAWAKWAFLAVLAGLGFVVGQRIITQAVKIGKVKKPRLWAPIDKHTIAILNDDMCIEHRIALPNNPETGKRLTAEEVQVIGITERGEEVNVEIKHIPVNRSGR